MKEENNFEEKMKDLENLVTELEKGDLNLDESVNKFEEGMKLSKECTDKLTEVTEKVNKILTENGTLENFEVKE